MNYKEKALNCLEECDYEGHLENSKKQYEETQSNEDLNDYKKAQKIYNVSQEIARIIAAENKTIF